MLKKLKYTFLLFINRTLRKLHLISPENYYRHKNYYQSLRHLNLTATLRNIDTFLEETSGLPQPEILLIMPDCSFTGAPLVLFKLAQILQNNGYAPACLALLDGPMRQDFEAQGIPVTIVDNVAFLPKAQLQKLAENFNLCLCNTILTHQEALEFQKFIPTILYIHEAMNLLDYIHFDPKIKENLPQIRQLVCPSEYSAEFIRLYTSAPIAICHNSVNDAAKGLTASPVGKTVKFALIGAMSLRKGIDTACAAFTHLPKGCAELHIIGKITPTAQKTFEDYQNYPGIIWHPQINNQSEKINLFNNLDVFLIPSRDESCSLVALESAMLSKPLIISRNVGASYLVEDSKNGFIVQTSDSNALAAKMKYFIDNKEKIPSMGKKCRQKYLQTSTPKIYEQNIIQLIANLSKRTTYNTNNRQNKH